MPLFQKLLVSFVLVAILPILGLGIHSYQVENRAAIQKETAKLNYAVERLAGAIDTYLHAHRALPQHLAETGEVREFLRPPAPETNEVVRMSQWLTAQQKIADNCLAILLLDRNGLCQACSRPDFIGVSYSFRDYFQEAIQGRLFQSDWQMGLVLKGPGLFVASPVRDETNIAGVVAVRFDTARIQQAIAAAGDESRSAFLINHMGILLAHTQSNRVYHTTRPLTVEEQAAIRRHRQFMDTELAPFNIEPAFYQAVSQTMVTTQRSVARYALDQHERRAALVRLSERDWVAGVSIQESLIFQRSQEILSKTILFTSAALVIACVVAYLVCQRLTRPIADLSRSMERFAGGEGSVRAGNGSADEIGKLSRSFNVMADKIQLQTRELSQRVNVLEGILPVCAWCKKIRNDQGVYEPMEKYITERTEVKFSHGLCPECLAKCNLEARESK
jgi:C4-dicarboxylate-specific signal transduction histidine kinase